MFFLIYKYMRLTILYKNKYNKIFLYLRKYDSSFYI